MPFKGLDKLGGHKWVRWFWGPFQYQNFKWKKSWCVANMAPIYQQYHWNIGKLSKYHWIIDEKWRKKWKNRLVDISISYLCRAQPIRNILLKYQQYKTTFSSLFHSWFVDLGNPFETVVHYLLIGGMTYLGHWDVFLMVSALVYEKHTRHDLQWIMT